MRAGVCCECGVTGWRNILAYDEFIGHGLLADCDTIVTLTLYLSESAKSNEALQLKNAVFDFFHIEVFRLFLL